jgi:hypothetical protein
MGLFFKNQGSNSEIMDCGLILEKHRGFFAKLSGIIDFRIIFIRKKSWTTSGLGPWRTGRGRRHRAHRRVARMALWLTDARRWQSKRGRGGDEPAWDLTRERKAVRSLGDGGRGRRPKCLGEGGAPSEEGRNG